MDLGLHFAKTSSVGTREIMVFIRALGNYQPLKDGWWSNGGRNLLLVSEIGKSLWAMKNYETNGIGETFTYQ